MSEYHEGDPRERLIEDILMRAVRIYDEIEENETYPTGGDIILEYGSKKIKLEYFSTGNDIYANTHIEKTKPKKIKIEGETTLLYEAVKKCMQKLVSGHNKPLRYTLMSGNRKMIKWAQTKGKEVFHWDEEEQTQDGRRPYWEFKVIIQPKV